MNNLKDGAKPKVTNKPTRNRISTQKIIPHCRDGNDATAAKLYDDERRWFPKIALVLRPVMILSGQEIRSRLGDSLQIDPFDPQFLNANSYDLSLHDELVIYEEVVLDAASPNRFRRISIPSEGLTLQPGQLYLGRTCETTRSHGVVPFVQGRSSLGRLGCIVNAGGGMGQSGYCGTWTLEIHVVQPVRIYAGLRVCQIAYHALVGKCDDYASDKYQHSVDIQPSLLHRELGYQDSETQMQLSFDEAIQSAR